MWKVKNTSRIFSKLVPEDISRTSGMLKGAVKKGWQEGKQQAKINNKGLVGDMYARSLGITKEVRKLRFSWEDMPAIAAAITATLPIPIPGLFMRVYVLGVGIRKAFHIAGKRKHLNTLM